MSITSALCSCQDLFSPSLSCKRLSNRLIKMIEFSIEDKYGSLPTTILANLGNRQCLWAHLSAWKCGRVHETDRTTPVGEGPVIASAGRGASVDKNLLDRAGELL